jgi:O-acetylhomoserine/O-acetylserine sulfhydrylase-like pyridoxal-dependent enzyme
VFPIEEVAAIGRPLGIPLIIDNTAAPIAIKPFDHGAAVVVYSATKYIVAMARRSAASSSIAANSHGRTFRIASH